MTSPSNGAFPFNYASAGDCFAVGIALPLVAMLVTGLRLVTRRIQRTPLGVDDWLILAGLVAVIGMGICFIYGAAHGAMGYPTPAPPANLTEEELQYYIDPGYQLFEILEFPFQIFMILGYGCIKMSIVAFYRRIFVVDRRSVFAIITLVTQVVLGLWTLTFLLLVIFPCGVNFWANWGSTAAQMALCPIAFTSEYGISGSDLVLDLYIFILPLPLVWSLHLSSTRKVMVSGILLLGASAIGASIGRLMVYIDVLEMILDGRDLDPKLVGTLSLYWSLLECGLALIAACLPTLSYLLARTNIRSIVSSVRSTFSLHSSDHGSRGQVSQRYVAEKLDVERIRPSWPSSSTETKVQATYSETATWD